MANLQPLTLANNGTILLFDLVSHLQDVDNSTPNHFEAFSTVTLLIASETSFGDCPLFRLQNGVITYELTVRQAKIVSAKLSISFLIYISDLLDKLLKSRDTSEILRLTSDTNRRNITRIDCLNREIIKLKKNLTRTQTKLCHYSSELEKYSEDSNGKKIRLEQSKKFEIKLNKFARKKALINKELLKLDKAKSEISSLSARLSDKEVEVEKASSEVKKLRGKLDLVLDYMFKVYGLEFDDIHKKRQS